MIKFLEEFEDVVVEEDERLAKIREDLEIIGYGLGMMNIGKEFFIVVCIEVMVKNFIGKMVVESGLWLLLGLFLVLIERTRFIVSVGVAVVVVMVEFFVDRIIVIDLSEFLEVNDVMWYVGGVNVIVSFCWVLGLASYSSD